MSSIPTRDDSLIGNRNRDTRSDYITTKSSSFSQEPARSPHTIGKMDMLKRLVRQTSNKLLAGLGAQGHSNRFVVNHIAQGIVAPIVTSTKEVQEMSTTRTRRKSLRGLKRKSHKKSSREAALLLAAKNYLPPVQFHHVHGKTAKLSKNHFAARRTQSFCQALVFSNRIILPNERVYIKVLELAKGWSGTIRFGFTSVDPATLRFKMPKHVCPDMTNAGHTWARALADEVVRKNSIIHFSYDKNGFIHYGINNQDCGIFCADVNTSQHLWFVVDVYGLTAAVELIDPRAHYSATGDLDDSILANSDASTRIGDEDDASNRFDLANSQQNMRSSLRERLAAAIAWETSRRRRPHSQLLPHLKNSGFDFQGDRHNEYFPNIQPALIPLTQQNIYSPMPNHPRAQLRDESHDYYQINQGHSDATDYVSARAQLVRGPMTKKITPMSQVNSSGTHSIIPSSVAGTSSAPSMANNPPRIQVSNVELDISQRLDAVHFNGHDVCGQQRHTATKSSKSITNSNANSIDRGAQPVAATRRRLPNNIPQTTNSKRPYDEPKINHTSTNLTSNAHSKTKTSHAPQTATKSNIRARVQKTASKDRNSNSPVTKDCPICFERPINCVLYQCGHMCTCYECGVKQWRTQSRTCPICRTIIKDVIKTYMS